MPTDVAPQWKIWTPPADPLPIALTSAHLTHLRSLAYGRFLTTTQLATLAGGNFRVAQRHLTQLFRAHLIVRPQAQIAKQIIEGRTDAIYAITLAGLKVIADQDGINIRKFEWSSKRKLKSDAHIHHQVRVNEFILPYIIACRDPAFPNFVDHYALLPHFPEATRMAPKPFQITARLAHKQTQRNVSAIPDRLFAFHFGDATQLLHAGEEDTGEETIDPTVFRVEDSSVMRKFLVYHTAFMAGAHTEKWGVKRFRVLFRTTTDERAHKLADACKKFLDDLPSDARRPGLFLFTDRTRQQTEHPFAPIWLTVKGERVSLLPKGS